MRGSILLIGLLVSPFAAIAEGPKEVPLLNVELLDQHGVQSSLTGFYRISGEDYFQGHLGSAKVRVPYQRVREVRVMAPTHPGARMRARFTLRSGKEVLATFDEREGEQLFTGFAKFGKVTIYFRDIRHLKILGRTKRSDLPAYGPPANGVDARVRDRQGVTTELLNFRRAAARNTVPAVRGSAAVAIPMRIVKRLTITPDKQSALSAMLVELRNGSKVQCRLPVSEEETSYTGEAEFGSYVIQLGDVRDLVIHRVTPVLRDLDPLEAAKGREAPEGRKKR